MNDEAHPPHRSSSKLQKVPRSVSLAAQYSRRQMETSFKQAVTPSLTSPCLGRECTDYTSSLLGPLRAENRVCSRSSVRCGAATTRCCPRKPAADAGLTVTASPPQDRFVGRYISTIGVDFGVKVRCRGPLPSHCSNRTKRNNLLLYSLNSQVYHAELPCSLPLQPLNRSCRSFAP